MKFGGRGRLRPVIVMAAILSSVSMFGLAACGGDGATAPVASPPPPPPPPAPPPPPPPPTAGATASVGAVDEGQPFSVDASGSTDPEGDALTFMWAQTAGTPVEIADPTLAVLQLVAPELTATSMATFEVTVSDAATSATASVDVELSNIDLSPNFVNASGVSQTFQVEGLVDIAPILQAQVALSLACWMLMETFNFSCLGIQWELPG